MPRLAAAALGAAVLAMHAAPASSAAPPARPPVVIAGAGLHGAALAYYLAQRGEKPLLVEAHSVACAASGKGGGFLARDWGSGPTKQLHKVSYALHGELAAQLGVASYRRIPVLSVQPGKRTARTIDICPWLDGDGVKNSDYLDQYGAAQVNPHELCTKLVEAAVAAGAELRIGRVEGVETAPAAEAAAGAAGAAGDAAVRAVVVDGEPIPARALAVCMGPWSALASRWLGVPVPMTGIRSTSIVFEDSAADVEPFALFCAEHAQHGCHLEVYPRSSGEVYLCGLGGSEYVDGERLVAGEYPPGEVPPDPARAEAATRAFAEMSRRLGGRPPSVTQACMRPCPPDALPIMGAVPGVRGAYLSCGHNCWGILWAPVSGKAMSELILDGEARCVDLRPFAPARFMPEKAAGTRGRKRGEQPVGEQW